MTAVNLLFLLFGVIALGSAVLVVSTRRIVHAALWLAVTLGALAACFLLLTAEFVAWVQVLIYVGAVVVLLLFALMLTRAPIEPSPLTSKNAVFAGVVAVAVALVLVTTLVSGFSGQTIDLAGVNDIGSARTMGEGVFSRWVLAFELLSVLLLAALVSAIVLSRRATAETAEQEGD